MKKLKDILNEVLSEAASPMEAAFEMLEKAQGSKLKKIQDSINVDDGNVSGRDRNAYGTIVIGGATFNWAMSTDDGISSSYLYHDKDRVDDKDNVLHDTLIDAVEKAGYALDDGDEKPHDPDAPWNFDPDNFKLNL